MDNFNYRLVLSYDGTNYFGFQKQKNVSTIQSVLENILFKMTKQKIIKFYSASRTDKGVHAAGQVVNFKTFFFIPLQLFRRKLNSLLPLDIRIRNICLVNLDFNARSQAQSKIYYYVFSKKPLNSFNYHFQVYYDNIDFLKIKEAMFYIQGQHDFSLFTKNKDLINYRRTIYNAKVKETKNNYILIFHGNSFMRYMIRFLVGFLIKISQNKKSLYDLQQMLKLNISQKATFLAPPQGLILKKVFY